MTSAVAEVIGAGPRLAAINDVRTAAAPFDAGVPKGELHGKAKPVV